MQFTYDTIKLSEATLIAALSEKYSMVLLEIHVERRDRREKGREGRGKRGTERGRDTHTQRTVSANPRKLNLN